MADKRTTFANRSGKKTPEEIFRETQQSLTDKARGAAGSVIRTGKGAIDAIGEFDRDLGQGLADVLSAKPQGRIANAAGEAVSAGIGGAQGLYDRAQGVYDPRAYDFASPAEESGYGSIGRAERGIGQGIYNLGLAAQQGKFPPDPPQPNVMANQMLNPPMKQTMADMYALANHPYGMMKDDATIMRQIQMEAQELIKKGQAITKEDVVAEFQKRKAQAMQGYQGAVDATSQGMEKGINFMKGLLQ